MSLGLGSVIASAVEVAPWLADASRHKGAIFVSVGGLLAGNFWLAIVRPRRTPCAPGDLCHPDNPAMRINRALFWASVVIYLAAVTAAYGALLWVRMQS